MKHRNHHAVGARQRQAGAHQDTQPRGEANRDAIEGHVFWEELLELVMARMLQGRAEYGDESFGKHPRSIAGEIHEEAADVLGWAFILWSHGVGRGQGDPLRRLPEYIRAANYATPWPPPERMTPHAFAVWVGAMGRVILDQYERIVWPEE